MIKLEEEKLRELQDTLDEAIQSYETDLQGLWDKFSEWEKAAEGLPFQAQKTYPHANAANVAVPATSVALKTMYGALWVGLSQRKPLVIVKPLQESPEQKDIADTLQEYLTILSEDDRELGMKRFLKDWLKSSCLYGVGFYKVTWDDRERQITVNEMDPDGSEKTVKYTVTEHFGPRVSFIQPTDVLFDQAFQDLQRSPCVLERFILAEHELKLYASLGYFSQEAVEQVLENLTSEDTPKEAQTREFTGTSRGSTKVAELYEAYVYMDIDDDGVAEDLLVIYHRDSGVVLSVDFNSYGERMTGSVAYEHRPGFLFGIGIGQQTEHMQRVINTLYNSRLDGIALTDAPIFLIRRGSPVPMQEEIYPGKRIPVETPQDVTPLVFEKSFLNTRQEEMNSIIWLQKNTGASDTLAGFPDSVMRTADTVGGQVLRLKQSSALFSTILANYEEALGDIYRKVVRVLVLHKDRVLEYERRVGRLDQEKLSLLEKALSVDPYSLPLKFSFSVNVTDVDETFEIQRQNVLTVVQIMNMYFERVLQLANLADSKQLGPLAMNVVSSALETATRQMNEILKLFGHEENTDSLPDTKKLAVLRQFAEAFLTKDLQAVGQVLQNQAMAGGGVGGQGVVPGGQVPGGAAPGGAAPGGPLQASQTIPGGLGGVAYGEGLSPGGFSHREQPE